MKKTQVLSAIALASALGVVVPVANASAITMEVKDNNGTVTTAGSASYAEAQNAIAYAKNSNPEYKALNTFYEAALAASKVKVGPVGTGTWNAADIAGVPEGPVVDVTDGLIRALIKKAKAYTMTAGTYAAVSAGLSDDAKALLDNDGAVVKTTVDAAQEVLNKIASTEKYPTYKALYDAVEKGDVNAYKTAAAAYNAGVAPAAEIPDVEDADATVLSNIKNNVAGNKATATDYQEFAPLIKLVETSRTAFETYKTQFNSIKAEFEKLIAADVLVDGVDDTYENMVKDGKATSIASIVKLVLTASSEAALKNGMELTSNVTDYGLYNNLTTAIKTLGNDTRRTDEKTIYDQIKSLATDYKTATGSTMAINDIIKAMAGYVTPTGPVEGDEGEDQNTPTDDKKEEDKKEDDKKAPNSGVVSSTENGASTTVSIVAGLATALTALGAGVVAYRNVRRSSEK